MKCVNVGAFIYDSSHEYFISVRAFYENSVGVSIDNFGGVRIVSKVRIDEELLDGVYNKKRSKFFNFYCIYLMI